MLKRINTSTRGLAISAAIMASLVLAGCSSSDDDDDVDAGAANETTVTFPLTVAQTTNDAIAPGANGDGTFTVNTDTGAISGTAVVSGTTGDATMAHIHRGAIGVAGDVAVGLEQATAGDASTWVVPANTVLTADDLALFVAGDMYVNIHTGPNAAGELRGQMVDGAPAGSFTFTFTNTSTNQTMTPPVVTMHTPVASGGVDLFEVGNAASDAVVAIAEDGNNDPMVTLLSDATSAGTVSDFAVAFTDRAAPGPLAPGASSTVTLTPSDASQVMSVVSMVICTNDGFSGIDSAVLPAADSTTTAPIYDAGSEDNVLDLNYWVDFCGGTGNIGDEEGGTVAVHPGQSATDADAAAFDFAAGDQLLQISITPN